MLFGVLNVQLGMMDLGIMSLFPEMMMRLASLHPTVEIAVFSEIQALAVGISLVVGLKNSQFA